jgi:hypothetical protein
MYFGVIMSKPEMKGRVTVKSLNAQCKIEGKNVPIAYSILGQFNGEMNTKVCAASRANVANIKSGSLCKDCYFTFNIEIAYSQSETITNTWETPESDEDFGFLPKLSQEAVVAEKDQDIINVNVEVKSDVEN